MLQVLLGALVGAGAHKYRKELGEIGADISKLARLVGADVTAKTEPYLKRAAKAIDDFVGAVEDFWAADMRTEGADQGFPYDEKKAEAQTGADSDHGGQIG
jgi:hypothetical protein